MKNTMVDLHNHLFEQLERLNDDDLDEKELEKEIRRAKAMTGIATTIINNAALGVEAEKLKIEHRRDIKLPVMLENK